MEDVSRPSIGSSKNFGRISLIGTSPAFNCVQAFIKRFSACGAPVLILGETGTGKELVARALHYMSPRGNQPFVPVNCGALPDQLFENEFFGHERGAFTDARNAQKGLVAMAHGGTLFLDEIDSLSPKAQAALLRFLQDREYRPLGSQTVYKADVRLISATNAKLAMLAKEGLFRQDLFFRLDVVSIEIPPLRKRREDIPLLASHFLRQFGSMYGIEKPRLDALAEAQIWAHPWPGNVRELENVMHRAVLAAGGSLVEGPLNLTSMGEEVTPEAPQLGADEFTGGLKRAKARYMMDFERRYLNWILTRTRGNVSAAARCAEADRRQLGRLIRRHGIDPTPYRDI